MIATCEECDGDLTKNGDAIYCMKCLRLHEFNFFGKVWIRKVCQYCGHSLYYKEKEGCIYCPNCLVNDKLDEDGMDDNVDRPDHYTRYPMEVIDMVRLVLNHLYGPDGFEAYCFGTELVYQLRAGKKSDALEDISKSLKYEQFRLESR